jgi:hypothetical protein
MFFSKNPKLAKNREDARKDLISAVDRAVDAARIGGIHLTDIGYVLENAAQSLRMQLAQRAPT